MKKIISLCVVCLWAVSAIAQSIAVMEFNAGSGVTQADVDGVSAIFNTYFQPSGYTIIERARIDRVIQEQGFQHSSLTETQKVKIGEILNVSEIVVGDVNLVLGQYNVDVRVISVPTGVRVAKSGADFAGSSYRETMKKIAQDLAGQIAMSAGPTIGAQSSTSSQSRTIPDVLYGYLKVFPNDLGAFESEPRQIISRINQSQQFGYGSWRLPTNEELALMRASNLIGSGNYMTNENKKGIIRLVTDKEKGVVINVVINVPEGYVDLGLPSGTLWKKDNEGGDNARYTYDEAVSRFGNMLPTKQQLEELKNECEWTWTGSSVKVIGPSGESIILPVSGLLYCDGSHLAAQGVSGFLWSSSPIDSDDAWRIGFGSSSAGVGAANRCIGQSVRLVQ